MQNLPPRPLVSTQWLADNLDNDRLRIFDCSVVVNVVDPAERKRIARDHYQKTHIPGAAFLDMAGELSDPASGLQFTLPDSDSLVSALGRQGIGDGHVVVLYSTTSPMWMTRAWWMIHSCGLEDVFVLDGGFARWQAENRPVAQGVETYPATRLNAATNPARWADRDEVLKAIGNQAVCILSALPRTEYTGESKAYSHRAGHITGSVNVPYESLVDGEGLFHRPERLREIFADVPALNAERVICYCGGGIAATMAALALRLLDHGDVAVYDGSMLEWSADPTMPMTLGGEAG